MKIFDNPINLESAENSKKTSFKNSLQFVDSEKSHHIIKYYTNSSENQRDNSRNIQRINTFNNNNQSETDLRVGDTSFPLPGYSIHNSVTNFNQESINGNGPTLFEMFDACLNNIVKPTFATKHEKEELATLITKEKQKNSQYFVDENDPKFKKRCDKLRKIFLKTWLRRWRKVQKSRKIDVHSSINISNNRIRSPVKIFMESFSPSKMSNKGKQSIFCSSEKKIEQKLDDRLLKHKLEFLDIDGDDDLLEDDQPNFSMIFNKQEILKDDIIANDYKDNNLLLTTDLSFCETNFNDEINAIEIAKPKINNSKTKSKARLETPKSKSQLGKKDNEKPKLFEKIESKVIELKALEKSDFKNNVSAHTRRRSISKGPERVELKQDKPVKLITARGNSISRNQPQSTTNASSNMAKSQSKFGKSLIIPSNKENALQNKTSPQGNNRPFKK